MGALSLLIKYAVYMEKIIDPINKELLKAELTAEKRMRRTNRGGNVLYIVDAHDSPNVMQEIGRLREITFRAVGEGTNRSIDLDEFDLYYYHLFIWDEEENCIVGAYRVGKGKRFEHGKIA